VHSQLIEEVAVKRSKNDDLSTGIIDAAGRRAR